MFCPTAATTRSMFFFEIWQWMWVQDKNVLCWLSLKRRRITLLQLWLREELFLSLWIATKNVNFNWNLMRIKLCIDWSSSQRIRGSLKWSPLPPQSRNAASSSEEPTRGGRWLTLLSNFEVKSVSNRHGFCFGWKRWSKRSIWIWFCCAHFACMYSISCSHHTPYPPSLSLSSLHMFHQKVNLMDLCW